MKRKWFFQIFLGIIFIIAMFSTSGASTGDYLIFSQLVDEEKRLYIVKGDGSDLRTVCSGKDITVFFLGKYLFYFQERQLFEYNLITQSSRRLARFNENRIFLRPLTDEPESPEQVLVITQSEDTGIERWYVMDLSDGSLRMLSRPPSAPVQSGTFKVYSPDGTYLAVIRQVPFTFRFELELRSAARGRAKAKTIWTLPKKMTILPDVPVWAPNSEMIAFYGKEYQNAATGFYSLFIYDIKRGQFITVQEQVFMKDSFARLLMEEFTPDWSPDGKYLIFEYQPYGLPTESSILKYEAGSGKKTYLAESPGAKYNPIWSPSGDTILFLSRQNGAGAQVFTIDAQGGEQKRISPLEGITEWARWYKSKIEE